MDRSTASFEQKISGFKKQFEPLSPSKKYEYLINLGNNLPAIDSKFKSADTLVHGCQSELYLHTELKLGKVYFSASSDALISKGLAALLITIYNGASPETILSSPPHFLEELGLYASLSPSRSNGISHIYLKMKLQTIILAKNELLGPQ